MLYEEEHDYQTLVVDSLDWLERIVHAHTCKTKKIDDIAVLISVEAMSLHSASWSRSSTSSRSCDHTKMNMIMLSHAAQVKVDNPGEEERMKWNLQLHHKSTAKFFQWSDLCLFANYEVRTTKESGSFGKQRIIAHGSERFLFTRDHANHAAKNRLGLPDPIEMDWELIQEFINNAKKKGK